MSVNNRRKSILKTYEPSMKYLKQMRRDIDDLYRPEPKLNKDTGLLHYTVRQYSKFMKQFTTFETYGTGEQKKWVISPNLRKDLSKENYEYYQLCKANNRKYIPLHNFKLRTFISPLDSSIPSLEGHLCGNHSILYNNDDTGKFALVVIDIDFHIDSNIDNDSLDMTNHIINNFHDGIYFDKSTKKRGYHLYLLVYKEGYIAQEINDILKKYNRILSYYYNVILDYNCDYDGVKANLKHYKEDWSIYCGSLCKAPRPDLEDIEQCGILFNSNKVHTIYDIMINACKVNDLIVDYYSHNETKMTKKEIDRLCSVLIDDPSKNKIKRLIKTPRKNRRKNKRANKKNNNINIENNSIIQFGTKLSDRSYQDIVEELRLYPLSDTLQKSKDFYFHYCRLKGCCVSPEEAEREYVDQGLNNTLGSTESRVQRFVKMNMHEYFDISKIKKNYMPAIIDNIKQIMGESDLKYHDGKNRRITYDDIALYIHHILVIKKNEGTFGYLAFQQVYSRYFGKKIARNAIAQIKKVLSDKMILESNFDLKNIGKKGADNMIILKEIIEDKQTFLQAYYRRGGDCSNERCIG